jgi:hypothetical protein
MRVSRRGDLEFRDEGLLRLFFADALRLDEARELVKRLRLRAEEVERDFRETSLPLARRLPAVTPGRSSRAPRCWFAAAISQMAAPGRSWGVGDSNEGVVRT